MNSCLEALKERFSAEPYIRAFGMSVVDLEEGRSVLQMKTNENMNNMFDCTHGAAIYSLMDAAFELAVNSHGTVAVALGVNVNYLNAPHPGEVLQAEGREVNRSRKIAACQINVTGEDGRLIATCQALAYRKKEELPFLSHL
ncbi:PaaI family thioesterase [archaeon]|nr:PaaI family thioesterase [archaeon]